MSFFQKETLENNKGLTAAALVVGAGVVVYVGYKYYKENLKGGKTGKELDKEEVTFKSQIDTHASKSFDKLEDLSKKSLEKDTEISDSFIILHKDLSNLPDPSKQLEQVTDKLNEGAKNVGNKLEEYKQDANKNIDAGVKAVNKTVEGVKSDISKGAEKASEQMNNAYADVNEKVKEGVKQASDSVQDFTNVAHDKINDTAKQTTDSLKDVTNEAHKKLDEGASDLQKKF